MARNQEDRAPWASVSPDVVEIPRQESGLEEVTASPSIPLPHQCPTGLQASTFLASRGSPSSTSGGSLAEGLWGQGCPLPREGLAGGRSEVTPPPALPGEPGLQAPDKGWAWGRGVWTTQPGACWGGGGKLRPPWCTCCLGGPHPLGLGPPEEVGEGIPKLGHF